MQGLRPAMAATSALSSATMEAAILFPSMRSMEKLKTTKNTKHTKRKIPFVCLVCFVANQNLKLLELQRFDLDHEVLAVDGAARGAENDDLVIRVFLDLVGEEQL